MFAAEHERHLVAVQTFRGGTQDWVAQCHNCWRAEHDQPSASGGRPAPHRGHVKRSGIFAKAAEGLIDGDKLKKDISQRLVLITRDCALDLHVSASIRLHSRLALWVFGLLPSLRL
jgi:hypothetical protein